jgi:hypothetical protein
MGSIYPNNILQNPSVAKRYIPKHKKHEESLQRQVCSYLHMQYPHVIFRSDYASGLHLTANQARIHASIQSSRAWPDLFIYLPRKVDGKQYAGMALELKKEGTELKIRRKRLEKKVGDWATPHIQEQYLMLKDLERVGYWTDFGVGIDDCINKIDYYMGKPINASIF